ncbi:MAG: shikimate dehydrogenase, partial [Lautropia sp.]|nr:shikimate dehydrogenase [Lautropia sp.]
MTTGAYAAGTASPVPPAAHRYLVVGNPIAHSRSPEIHAAFARQTGAAIRYERLLVPTEPPDAFARAMDAFFAGGGRGANVTLPFKERAFAYVARRSEGAALAQAVNTLAVRDDGIHGDNTDGPGLVADLCGRLGLDLAGKSVLLLGAGGAARGVVGSLLQAGIAELSVVNRTRARADLLAARFNDAACARSAGLPRIQALDLAAVRPADLIVNATSSGLLNGTLVLPPTLFRHCLLAYD